jgi:hypothetical protein
MEAITCPACRVTAIKTVGFACVRESCDLKKGNRCIDPNQECSARINEYWTFCSNCNRLLTIGNDGWVAGIGFCTCSLCLDLKIYCPKSESRRLCVLWDAGICPCNCPVDIRIKRAELRKEIEEAIRTGLKKFRGPPKKGHVQGRLI